MQDGGGGGRKQIHRVLSAKACGADELTEADR